MYQFEIQKHSFVEIQLQFVVRGMRVMCIIA